MTKEPTDDELDHAYRHISRALMTLWDDDADLFLDLMEVLGMTEEYLALSPADQKHLRHEFCQIGRRVDRLVAEAHAVLDCGVAA